MRRATVVQSLVPALVLIGCGYTELHEAVLRSTPGPTSKVEIYVGDQRPARPFYEIALVEAFGYGSEADVEDLTAALEGRAKSIGCDALVRTRFDLGQSVAHGYGVCVRYSPTAPATIQVSSSTPAAPPPPVSPGSSVSPAAAPSASDAGAPVDAASL